MASLKSITRDSYLSMLPASKATRCFGAFDLMAIQICFGIAAWFFLTGSLTGTLLQADDAIAVILFGNCIPLFLIAFLALVPARYGVDQLLGSASCFGHNGSILMLFFFMFALFPATAIASLMFGESLTELLTVFDFANTGSSGTYTTIFAVIALLIGGYIAYLGPTALKWFTRISACMMMLILVGLVLYVLLYNGIDTVFASQPVDQFTDAEVGEGMGYKWSVATALEANVGLGLSWGFFFGQWTRLAKSESAAYHGCLWGWGLLAAIAGVFSAFTALITGIYDPTQWMKLIGREMSNDPIIYGSVTILGLLFFMLANITSVSTLIYPGALSLKTRIPKVSWVLALVIAGAPALILFNDNVYSAIGSVYSFIGLVTGIYAAILTADYVFVGKGRLRLRELYNVENGYRYKAGWNPAAIVAIIVGFITYLLIYNPLTGYSITGLFPYLTASLPTFFVTGAVYTILMKKWVLGKYNVPFVNDFEPVSDTTRAYNTK